MVTDPNDDPVVEQADESPLVSLLQSDQVNIGEATGPGSAKVESKLDPLDG